MCCFSLRQVHRLWPPTPPPIPSLSLPSLHRLTSSLLRHFKVLFRKIRFVKNREIIFVTLTVTASNVANCTWFEAVFLIIWRVSRLPTLLGSTDYSTPWKVSYMKKVVLGNHLRVYASQWPFTQNAPYGKPPSRKGTFWFGRPTMPIRDDAITIWKNFQRRLWCAVEEQGAKSPKGAFWCSIHSQQTYQSTLTKCATNHVLVLPTSETDINKHSPE